VNPGPSLDNIRIGGSPKASAEARDEHAREYVCDLDKDQVQV
jgi:hypothetical protein